MKCCRNGPSEVFPKKTIPKFLEYFKKSVHYGEQLIQSYTYNDTENYPHNE